MILADLYSTASFLKLGEDSRPNEEALSQPFRNRVISDANASIIVSLILPFCIELCCPAWGMAWHTRRLTTFGSPNAALLSDINTTANTMRGNAREGSFSLSLRLNVTMTVTLQRLFTHETKDGSCSFPALVPVSPPMNPHQLSRAVVQRK